jgi:Carboxypeptidase regulatory-like domain
MTEIRTLSGKILLALFCSLMMVFQPILGAPDSSVVGRNTMDVAPPFVSHGEPDNPSESIAVAKVTGTADRNGQPLLNGSIVSSGDSLSTHGNSALLLASTPQERLWLGPNSSAKLTKEAGNIAVALARGTLSFQTSGHIHVSVENHDGLALRSRAGTAVLAQLSLVNNQEAQVRVQEGSLELVEGNRSVLLQPEQSGRVSSASTRTTDRPMTKNVSGQETASTQSDTGSIAGSVVTSDLFIVSGANVTLTGAAGKILSATSDVDGKFAFSNVPAGTYTLSVVKAGFKNYDLKNVVVRAGNESSLYVQLAGGGGAKKDNSNLLLWVVIGGVAAVGIGVGVGLKGSSNSNSPSTVK